MKIAHVIWDWNGTLLDDAETCVRALNVVLGRRGRPEVTPEEYRRVFRFPVRDYYADLGLRPSEAEWTELAEEYNKLYLEYAAETPLRDGVAAALAEFRGRGIGMSVLSAAATSVIETMTAARGIREYFDYVCGLPNFFADSKIEIARKLAARIGTDVDGVLMVGDTTHDYEVAQGLGCGCVLVAGGHQARWRLAECDCAIVDGVEGVVEYVKRAEEEER